MSEELKPCPFCGGADLKTAGDDKVVHVYCRTCESTGPNQYDIRHDWNTRNADQQAATIAELRTGIHSIVKELRSWQFKTRIAEPYQVPEYEDFVKIVHAIEIAAEK